MCRNEALGAIELLPARSAALPYVVPIVPSLARNVVCCGGADILVCQDQGRQECLPHQCSPGASNQTRGNRCRSVSTGANSSPNSSSRTSTCSGPKLSRANAFGDPIPCSTSSHPTGVDT